MNELNILFEALEGKMSSVYRWVRLDLGLSLTSCVSKDDTPALGIRAKSCTSQGFPKKETNTLPVAAALKVQKRHVDGSIHKTENVPPLNALVGLSSWKLEMDDRSFPLPGKQDVIDLSVDEEDEKGTSIKQSGNSQTHICSEGNASSIFIKVEGCGEGERDHKAISLESSCFKVHENVVPEQKSQQVDEVKLCYEDDESEEMDAGSRSTQSSQALSSSQFGLWNISNQHIHQVNLNVEPLNFGTLHAGKLWSDSRAIYPNGFRSRVRYINVLDPTNMCYYISQIVDIERDGPLFMVCVEHCPSEVFVHTSAARCWDMVRERVNLEIAKQHKLGKVNLPPLQPPGSVDGIKMFGFSTPEIVQTIQAMDQQYICSEYWRSRPPVRICWENASYTRLKSEKSN